MQKALSAAPQAVVRARAMTFQRGLVLAAGASLWLLGLTAALYLGRSHDPFLSDDYMTIAQNSEGMSLSLLWDYLTQLHMHGLWYRPLYELTVRLNHALFGLDPWGYHLTNLLLYWLTLLMVAGLCLRLTGSGWAALGGGTAFGVYGYHPEAVIWLSGRADLLAGLFSLGAFLGYIVAREELGKGWLYPLSVLAFGAALLSKETSVFLPLALLAYEGVYRPASPGRFSALPRLGPYLLLLALYLPLRLAAGGGYLRSWDLASIPLNYAYHLVTPFLILPGDFLSAGAAESWREAPGVPLVILGLALGGLALALPRTLPSLWGSRPLRLGLLWLALAPLPSIMVVAERFTYLPSFGFALLVAAWLATFLNVGQRRLGRSTFLALLGLVALLAAHSLTALWRAHWWGESAATVQRTVQQVVALYPQGPPQGELAFLNLPDTIRLALAFKNVLPAALWLHYGTRDIRAQSYYDNEWPLATEAERLALAAKLAAQGKTVFIYREGTLSLYQGPSSPPAERQQ